MNNNNNLEFLDILSIISFSIQMANQGKLISIDEFQKELHKAVSDIHQHLEIQDDKIDKIMEVLNLENNQNNNRND